jgi:hypothetical protein
MFVPDHVDFFREPNIRDSTAVSPVGCIRVAKVGRVAKTGQRDNPENPSARGLRATG